MPFLCIGGTILWVFLQPRGGLLERPLLPAYAEMYTDVLMLKKVMLCVRVTFDPLKRLLHGSVIQVVPPHRSWTAAACKAAGLAPGWRRRSHSGRWRPQRSQCRRAAKR